MTTTKSPRRPAPAPDPTAAELVAHFITITKSGLPLALAPVPGKQLAAMAAYLHAGTFAVDVLETATVGSAVTAEQARRAAEYRSDLENEVRRMIAKAKAAVEPAAAEIASYATYGLDSQWHAIDSYLSAIAVRDIWAGVEHVDEYLARQAEQAEPRSYLLDAVTVYADELTNAMVENRYRPCSTDPASNGAQLVKAEETSRFLRCYLVLASRRVPKADAPETER